jgi:carbamoyltransferase
MVILGLNAYHGDSSACIVIDGTLVCAIEEERVRRIKHWAGLPVEAIQWCLSYSGVEMADVDYIAVARKPSAHLHKKIVAAIARSPSLDFLKNRLSNAGMIGDVREAICKAFSINGSSIKAKSRQVEHHRAHIASSFLVSPFEDAVCMSVDGFGDFVSTMRAVGSGTRIDIHDWVEFPHSLGIFYTAMTQYLGFWNYGDEYKVMGLSATGESRYTKEMREMVRLRKDGLFDLDQSYFLHAKEGVDMTWDGGSPTISRVFSDKVIRMFGPPRAKDGELTDHYQDVAASVQAMYEEAFFHMLNDSYKRFKIERLALAGGCIQNSLANGKILDRTPFKDVYVQPASHDAGTAIGAAFWVQNKVLGKDRAFVMNSPYWGPQFTDQEIKKILQLGNGQYERLDEDALLKRVARDIAEGKIVGWFQGRTEWGPRALGNRSILVDPRKKEMKDILNARIKRRESFRPFAPSILEDQTATWFERADPVPFMEKVYMIKEEKKDLIPAVTHFDGTGRLQTVSRDMNKRYYDLIHQFFELTGVPIVLNTSFNENEPIVNTPKHALDCFERTKMDVLVLGDFYVTI